MSQCIYLDYAAATPLDSAVYDAMHNFLMSNNYANPSSAHKLGRKVKEVVDERRGFVAELISANSNEIIWTSGATESNNLALIGVANACKHLGNHIVTFSTEHESILNTCNYLEKEGFQVSYLVPDENGCIDVDEVESSITNKTILLSVMMINNETGVINKIKSICNVAKKYGVLVHVDSAQAVGKFPINVKEISVDLMSISAHKMYGPKGIGALYVDSQASIQVQPIMYGGSQEFGLRPGTLATHQIVGFGEACVVAKNKMATDYSHAVMLRDKFLSLISKCIRLNFQVEQTSPYIISVYIPKLSNSKKKYLTTSSDIILSSRSACSSAKSNRDSHVLQSIGFSKNIIENSYRISIGRYTSENEINLVTTFLNKLCGD